MKQFKDYNNALFWLTWTRFREFWREPESIFWGYGFPLVLVLVLGIAFRDKPVETFAICVISSAESPPVFATLSGEPSFQVTSDAPEGCRLRLRSGKAELIINVDHAAHLRYIFDPTRAEALVARDRAQNTLERAAGRQDKITVTEEPSTEVGSRYIDFLVPGLLGSSIMSGGLWGVGFAAVDLRIRRLLKRYAATPMRRGDFLLSIIISRLMFLIPEMIVMMAFAWLIFGVQNQGSWLAVATFSLLGAFAFSGIGLLVGSRAGTLETAMGLINLVSMPLWMLSGVFFPHERFPAMAQPFIRALPLTPLIDSLRAITMEGATLASQTNSLIILTAWTLVTFFLALKIFRWT
jgi:ABC-2 type transport system permease protein